MNFVAWLDIGLFAGWLAYHSVKGGGYSVIGDLIAGVMGALLSGALAAGLLGGGVFSHSDVIPIIVALLGAVVSIAVIRIIHGRLPAGWKRGAPNAKVLPKPESEPTRAAPRTFHWIEHPGSELVFAKHLEPGAGHTAFIVPDSIDVHDSLSGPHQADRGPSLKAL